MLLCKTGRVRSYCTKEHVVWPEVSSASVIHSNCGVSALQKQAHSVPIFIPAPFTIALNCVALWQVHYNSSALFLCVAKGPVQKSYPHMPPAL